MTRPVETEAKTANPADVLVSRPSLLEYRHFARLIAVFVFILSPRKWQNPLVNLRNATQFAMLDVDLDQVMTINRVIVFLRAGQSRGGTTTNSPGSAKEFWGRKPLPFRRRAD